MFRLGVFDMDDNPHRGDVNITPGQDVVVMSGGTVVRGTIEAKSGINIVVRDSDGKYHLADINSIISDKMY